MIDLLNRRRHDIEAVLLILFALGCAVDLELVYQGYTSISWDVWCATNLHPTLIAAGMLLTFAVSWEVRDRWGLVMLAGLLGGHLFTHW